MNKPLLLLLPLLMLCTTSAEAGWKTSAKVRYEQSAGFTSWTNATVTFATGRELNRVATNGQLNPDDARFAVIPMTSGELDVVRLSGFAACNAGFTAACLPDGRADGFDGSGRHWQVCLNDVCE